MKLQITIFISIAFMTSVFAQQKTTPLEQNNYQKVTSYDQLSAFVKQLDENSDLLKVETTDDLFISLRRVLPLIDHKANISQLARDVYWWNDDIKKQWAYSYRWTIKQSA